VVGLKIRHIVSFIQKNKYFANMIAFAINTIPNIGINADVIITPIIVNGIAKANVISRGNLNAIVDTIKNMKNASSVRNKLPVVLAVEAKNIFPSSVVLSNIAI